jgi:tetratricopeptide (TPR) repeat protein
MGKLPKRVVIGEVLILLLFFGCRHKAAVAPLPTPNTEVLRYLAEGDAGFSQGHLYGWRQAEAAYKKACELSRSEELKRKLLVTRFLILMRQIDEDIPNPHADEVIKEICAGDESRKAQCEIAKWYRNYKVGKKPEIRSGSVFNGEFPEIEAYMNSLLPDEGSAGNPKPADLSDPLRESPLFLYLSPVKLRMRDPAEIEAAYPQFAEAFELLAESSFQKKKYRTAQIYFRKAVELIPDYTRAIDDLGNIYFFALEDYERALRYYESALKQDPTNVAAQFGRGASLHKLDRHSESNAVLDQMLAADLVHDGRLDSAGYHYYSGEGNYLKAYNYHLMKDPIKARELVDTARKFLPDSEEINDLSGELFFEARELEESRKEFLKVIVKGNSNCRAQMRLGLIYQQMKHSPADVQPQEQGRKVPGGYQETWSLANESAEKKALNYFLGAGSCMESAIKNVTGQINAVPSLDLDPNEKSLLKDRLRYKLGDMRASYAANIEMMIGKASENSLVEKNNYLILMREILARIQKQ